MVAFYRNETVGSAISFVLVSDTYGDFATGFGEETEELSEEDDVLAKLGEVIGGKKCLEYVYRDSTWDELILNVSEIGKSFETGSLKVCYINNDEANDFVLLPGEDTTVIAVSPQCPRERFIQVLRRQKDN